MIYCVDCQHCILADMKYKTDAARFARCTFAPNDDGSEYVAPEAVQYQYCSVSRKNGPCGPNASLFLKTHDATASAAVAAMDKLMNGDPQ